MYQGKMPRAGEIVEIGVDGEAMKARVGVVSLPKRRPRDPAVRIYIEEV
jgi:hypothetical protein